MTHTCFDVTFDNKIAHIVMKRPEKRNSMLPEFWDELPAIIRDIDDRSAARVIVLSSTGPHFTSGLDLNAFMSPPAEGEKPVLTKGAEFMQLAGLMQETFSVLEECRVPVLAAIQGGCIGGGVDLVTACDMRYATEDAYITIQETNIGMTADVGTFPRLMNLIPEGLARELAYTGRKMFSQEAQQHGLFNKVYPDQARMLEDVMQIAQQIAAHAPLAVYGCKRMINYSRDHTTADALDYVVTWNASMLLPEQMMEAVMANAQKRPGDFAELPPKKISVKK